MSFPPAHFLVGAGVAELTLTAVPLPRWKAWVVGGLLAVSPDVDIGLGMLLGRGGEYHGTFTHSVFAVVVVTLVAAALAGRRWAFLAGATYASHLAVDLLDDRGRTNVMLGWPLTLDNPDAIARVFPTVPFEQGRGALHAALSLLHPVVLHRLIEQTMIGALFFLALVAWAALIRVLGAAGARESRIR
ncbi:MAG TPA: metal-dependent hydrolase [Longimicrobiaceae bacterium]|nr:metal-dependent hydrolase [Longimicrobiaceae bacterium]